MKKIRKKRKLTDEQKAVLVERITKAREAKKPAAQLSIHETVRNLPDDDIFSVKNVRSWIKNAKDKLSGMRSWKNSKEKGQASEYLVQQGYLHNLKLIYAMVCIGICTMVKSVNLKLNLNVS